ncbi:MAG: hypothetical protein ACYC3I_03170 [Gemmataceae bacterium]
MIDLKLQERFARSVSELTLQVQAASINVEDEDEDAKTRRWLDGSDLPFNWAGPGITPDEIFFVTTLYGTMTTNGR